MSTRASNLRNWVIRTVGNTGMPLNDIHQHFSVQHPQSNRRDLEEVLESEKDFVHDDQQRVTLSPQARAELEEINRHDASQRAGD